GMIRLDIGAWRRRGQNRAAVRILDGESGVLRKAHRRAVDYALQKNLAAFVNGNKIRAFALVYLGEGQTDRRRLFGVGRGLGADRSCTRNDRERYGTDIPYRVAWT